MKTENEVEQQGLQSHKEELVISNAHQTIVQVSKPLVILNRKSPIKDLHNLVSHNVQFSVDDFAKEEKIVESSSVDDNEAIALWNLDIELDIYTGSLKNSTDFVSIPPAKRSKGRVLSASGIIMLQTIRKPYSNETCRTVVVSRTRPRYSSSKSKRCNSGREGCSIRSKGQNDINLVRSTQSLFQKLDDVIPVMRLQYSFSKSKRCNFGREGCSIRSRPRPNGPNSAQAQTTGVKAKDPTSAFPVNKENPCRASTIVLSIDKYGNMPSYNAFLQAGMVEKGKSIYCSPLSHLQATTNPPPQGECIHDLHEDIQIIYNIIARRMCKDLWNVISFINKGRNGDIGDLVLVR
ncbi:hypothetical protein RND71_002075 [Anisodus tanguticus]|uniref:Uncharacterized protein n=1 Tax=Anisodus tanguticus TaxID=243964 RepID=A0AAE1VRM6_9SOLA|nr:hypothetical protein RND71_002075 [Anisodus tanguticus]